MAKKKTSKKAESKEPQKKTAPKKKTEKKYTLKELVAESTMPIEQMILLLVDSGYYTQYKKELSSDDVKPSITKTEFRKTILRR